MSYYSYVIRSLKNGILYKGSSENIERRLKHHNAGESNYTSKHMPWEMIIVEQFETRAEAVKREKWYKSGAGRDWIKSQLNPSLSPPRRKQLPLPKAFGTVGLWFELFSSTLGENPNGVTKETSTFFKVGVFHFTACSKPVLISDGK